MDNRPSRDDQIQKSMVFGGVTRNCATWRRAFPRPMIRNRSLIQERAQLAASGGTGSKQAGPEIFGRKNPTAGRRIWVESGRLAAGLGN